MSHNKHKKSFNYWIKHNNKWLLIVLIIIFFVIAFMLDRETEEIKVIDNEIIYENNNYDAIITIIDGEGESTFTNTWGSVIKEGYPICSTLVTDYVGKNGFMNWETIEALNNVGTEFVFHSSAHRSYNDMTEEEIINDIEHGINAMEEHGINHRSICWITNTSKDICELGNKYFDVGITDNPSISTLDGNKSNSMMVADVFGSNDQTYFTYQQLKQLIDIAIQNNGWLVLFTRNNHKMMDSTQIDIYRQAFEYAKEHNVAVVTASEGYDLYYGNKLGNN